MFGFLGRKSEQLTYEEELGIVAEFFGDVIDTYLAKRRAAGFVGMSKGAVLEDILLKIKTYQKERNLQNFHQAMKQRFTEIRNAYAK